MQQLFNIDSKFMAWLCTFADLFVLNLLTLMCSLPVFTIGASFTAMHAVLLAIHRKEEGSIIKLFFKSFLSNFRQASLIWVMYVLYGAVLLGCFHLIGEQLISVPAFFNYFLYALALLMVVSLSWVFILQCRYDNPVWVTIKNSFVVGITHIKYTVVIVVLFLTPFILCLVIPQAEPILLCLGFSCPGIIQAKVYSKVTDTIDEMIYNRSKENTDS